MISDVCQAAVPALLRGHWVECGLPGVSRYRYACVHEHMVERTACAAHKPWPGSTGCRACADLGHDCEMTFEEILPAG